MNSLDLRERLEKAKNNVEKIKKTIERHQKQAEKKKAIIEENGWGFDRRAHAQAGHDDAYWAICEYENKLSDIQSAEKKLAEAEKIAENWRAKLERQLEVERTMQTEIPEIFKEVRDDLAELWTQWDINARERMKAKKKELEEKYNLHNESYNRYDWEAHRAFDKEWRDLYTYSKEESLRKTDEEFYNLNKKAADDWLLDLYNRVYAITGEITDCSNIHWGGKALDGIVIGKEGTAVVDTIDAGGYNIQRYHLRTLVHELKKKGDA